MDARALEFADASFDTALLLGNTLGIAGTPDGLRALLTRLHAIVRPGGQLLVDFTDYTATSDAGHLRYHRRNRARGAAAIPTTSPPTAMSLAISAARRSAIMQRWSRSIF